MAGTSGGTEVRPAVSGADAEAQLLALRDWLAAEDTLRGTLRWHRTAPEPGQMGEPDGREVILDVRRAADPHAVVREVTAVLDASHGRDA